MSVELDLRNDLSRTKGAVEQAISDRETKLQSFKDWIQEQLVNSGVVDVEKDINGDMKYDVWRIHWHN